MTVTRVYPDLFRYIENPHHQSLLERGEILVGTLRKYKDTLAEGDLRSDAGEGEFTIHQNQDHFATSQDVPESFKKEMSAFNMGIGLNWTFTNNRTVHISPNCLVMSLSTKSNDPNLFKKFGNNCFKITNLKEFAAEITKSLRAEYGDLGIRDPLIKNIIYKTREAHYSEGIKSHPVWVKSADYKEESEFRVVWEVSNPQNLVTHYIISNKNLRQYIALIST